MEDRRLESLNRAQSAEMTLDLLDAIDGENALSQRGLASRLGVALGLTNALIKRCVRKGLLKVQEAPARRYAYYLTPKGFLEKSRLTAEYLSVSLDLFRDARRQCDALIEECENHNHRRIVLIGVSDLAEIAVLSAVDTGIEIVAVVDAESNRPRVAGVPVVRSLDEGPEFDRAMITDMSQPQDCFQRVRKQLSEDRLLILPVLRINPDRSHGGKRR